MRPNPRFSLALALGLRDCDAVAAVGCISADRWTWSLRAATLQPRVGRLVGRFNAVDVWTAACALSLSSIGVDVEHDPTLLAEAHIAMELRDAVTAQVVCKMADCPRGLTAFVTEWLAELKVNLAITQILKGCVGEFSPETLVVPFSAPRLPPQYAARLGVGGTGGGLWILKHDGTSGGAGVVLVDSVMSAEVAMAKCRRQLTSSQQVLGSGGNADKFHFVLQRYVSDPMLLDGYKFGLRAYTISRGGATYLYDDYFIKVAGQPYDTPTGAHDSSTSRRAHITHTLRGPTFEECLAATSNLQARRDALQFLLLVISSADVSK
jgi:hypothetical protein